MTKKLIFTAIVLGLIVTGGFAIASHQALAYGYGSSHNCGCGQPTQPVYPTPPVNCGCNQPTPPPPPAPVYASCSANTTYAQTGTTVTWTANVSGGNGNFNYSWSGSDGLSGSGNQISHSYNSAGQQTATVNVTSNGQSASANCYTTIYAPYVPPVYNPPVYTPPVVVYQPPVVVQTYAPITVSCQANPVNATVGSTVTWTAFVSGGYSNNGYYGNQYNDGYTTNGSQNAYGIYQNNSLNAYGIYNGNTNYNTNYNSNVYNNGAYNGGYSLSWTGTDGLAANNSTIISKTYITPGQKVATVSAYENGQTVTASCATFIGAPAPIVYGPTQRVYLNQVPYTGEGSVLKVGLFVAILAIWSAFVAWILIKRRQASADNRLAAAGINTAAPVSSETISGNFLTRYVAQLRQGQSKE